jgi:hypothetical protein
MRRCCCLLAVLAPLVVAAPAQGETFQQGDLVVAESFTPGDSVSWLRADGSLVQQLEPVPGAGMEFGPDGRLYTAGLTTGKVFWFEGDGTFLGAFIETFDETGCGAPSDVSFDAQGNLYIGSFTDCDPGARKFDSNGSFLAAATSGESDQVDLAADQCTLWVQIQNTGDIETFDQCTGEHRHVANLQGTFGLEGENRGLRLLPDGAILTNEREFIVRMSPSGDALQLYDDDACTSWTGMALSVDGTSFWASCVTAAGTFPWEIDVATGKLLRTLDTPGIVRAVRGGFRAGPGTGGGQDSIPPTAQITTPAEGATFILGEKVASDYSCDDTGGSGLDACIGTNANGEPIDTGSVGAKTYTVTARDGAGNETTVTVRYRVVYDFRGFFPPVDDPPDRNVVTAGRIVPVLWRLLDASGDGVTTLTDASLTSARVDCDTGEPAGEPTEAGGRLLRLGKGVYAIVWRTSEDYARSCRELTLDLDDGTTHTALFRFRR